MTSTAQATAGVPPQQQYVVSSVQQPGSVQRPTQTVRYSKNSKQTVKGLTITQLILGIIIFICHAVTTGMDDEVTNRVAKARKQYKTYGLLTYGLADDAATGIWVGLGTVLAASIGIAGYRQQRKGLIITHLILNVFLLMAYPVLMGTLSSTIHTLQYCRTVGEYFYRTFDYSYSYYDYFATTTTTALPVLFGEKLKPYSNTFHCSHSLFKTWLAIDAVLLVCCLMAFFITLVLLIYNSIAACMCCRRTGCCGSCCCKSCYDSTGQEVPAVAYSTQQPVQQFVQPHAVPQQPAVPQYYPQPGQYGQQPAVMAPPVPTYPAASAPQLAANNPESKGEDLPPEYRAVASQPN